MRRCRFLLCMALVLCTLFSVFPAARAEEFAPDERYDGKTWDEVIADFLEKWGTDEKNITLGYYNTVTGEEHYLNPDQYMVTGSMYKVPLNMAFVAKITDGEMDWDTPIGAYKYETLLDGSIVYSDNTFARILWEKLGNGSYRTYRRIIAPLMGEDPDTVDAKYYENNFFTARQMIFCLRELYENQDRYPRIIETMQRAEPEEYFKRRERRFDIAHKYGFLQTDYHLYMNDCGIAFTDDPILLVMFTDNVNKAYEVMTDYCTLMCDYAQYHTVRRIAEEEAEAARQAELSRQAAERAGQEAEEIRQEAERAVSGSPEPDPTLTPAETQPPLEGGANRVTRLVRRAEQEGLSRTDLLAGAGVLLCGLIVLIVLAVLGKNYRVRSRYALLAALLLCLIALGRIGWPAIRQHVDRPSGDPQETVREFFAALEQGDYARAYACLDGVTTLGLEQEPETESAKAVYRALREQFSGELYGACTVDGAKAYQLVECRYLNMNALEWDARSETMTIISRYAASHSVGDLYDENNNYRPELMREAWGEAIGKLLEHPEDYATVSGIQLELRWHNGAWHIQPSEKLLELLLGGVSPVGEEAQP